MQHVKLTLNTGEVHEFDTDEPVQRDYPYPGTVVVAGFTFADVKSVDAREKPAPKKRANRARKPAPRRKPAPTPTPAAQATPAAAKPAPAKKDD